MNQMILLMLLLIFHLTLPSSANAGGIRPDPVYCSSLLADASDRHETCGQQNGAEYGPYFVLVPRPEANMITWNRVFSDSTTETLVRSIRDNLEVCFELSKGISLEWQRAFCRIINAQLLILKARSEVPHWRIEEVGLLGFSIDELLAPYAERHDVQAPPADPTP